MNYGSKNAHDLLPPGLAAALPKLYSQENEADPMVVAKFFTPDAGATWLIIEGETRDEQTLFFCFACLGPDMRDCAELGMVDLAELIELRGPMRMRVERDLYWKPMPLSQAKKREFDL